MIVNRHYGSTYYLPALGREGQGQGISYPNPQKTLSFQQAGKKEGDPL
jgi:hypothetical protein